MAIDGNSNCMFLTQISDNDMTIRLLEDDEITATGTYYGLYSYKSTFGGKITIPSCIISTYTLKQIIRKRQLHVNAQSLKRLCEKAACVTRFRSGGCMPLFYTEV